MYTESDHIKQLVDTATHIVIIQADNPDADSLGSSLALEHILGDLGKQVTLYCGVDVPGYLRYLSGWDRVVRELPKQFDASIIVDASTLTLLEKLQTNGEMGWLAAKPCIVLDHHGTVDHKITFAAATLLDDHASSTGELIYNLANDLAWPVSADAGTCLMTAILGDTQGLTNDLASAATYRAMAELIELGVNRPLLEESRREFNKMTPEIFKYKGRLVERVEFTAGGRIAHVTIPQHEINSYSPLYNPVPLIQGDMLATSGVALAIVFKEYSDGKTTAAIRANIGFAVADKLAAHMSGGGHPYASGFKITTGKPFTEIKAECLTFAAQLLDQLDAAPLAR
jgi:phosphoesterase RecJ-like protein